MLGEAATTVNALSAQAQLAQTGTPTTARVIAMQPTGTMINLNPQVQTALEVQDRPAPTSSTPPRSSRRCTFRSSSPAPR